MAVLKIVYETGVETPEVLGSGSTFSHVLTTGNEQEAFREYGFGGRNYLLRRTYMLDQPHITEWWDDDLKCWKS